MTRVSFLRRLPVVAIALVLLPGGLAACGGASGDEPSARAGPTYGEVPDRITHGDTVTVTECRTTRTGQAQVEAEVLNTGSAPASLQGVPITVTDSSGEVISTSSSQLWNSITIGPGRKALVSDELDLDADPAPGAAISCRAGAPDLRPDGDLGSLAEAEELGVSLKGCGPSDEVVVRNPTDEPIGVELVVEFFDSGGNSVGTEEFGHWPTTYSNGDAPDETEKALSGGAAAEYPITVTERMAEWDTPSDGPIVGCELVSADYQTDPEPIEVIVD